jgi:hypothetical protein
MQSGGTASRPLIVTRGSPPSGADLPDVDRGGAAGSRVNLAVDDHADSGWRTGFAGGILFSIVTFDR